MDAKTYRALLTQAGVRPDTLDTRQRTGLTEQGYTVLPQVLDAAQLEAMRAQCDAWGEDPASGAVHLGGNMRIPVLNPGHTAPLFVLGNPAVLAAAWHVMERPFASGAVAWRNPRQGLGQQGLHADWGPRDDVKTVYTATLLCLLDDYTADNGATRVVPGSHHLKGAVPKQYAQPLAHHPREVLVQARAGDVLFFNGHLWHAGTRNVSGAPRRVMQASIRPWVEGSRGLLLQNETLASPLLRQLLGLQVYDPAVDVGLQDAAAMGMG